VGKRKYFPSPEEVGKFIKSIFFWMWKIQHRNLQLPWPHQQSTCSAPLPTSPPVASSAMEKIQKEF